MEEGTIVTYRDLREVIEEFKMFSESPNFEQTKHLLMELSSNEIEYFSSPLQIENESEASLREELMNQILKFVMSEDAEVQLLAITCVERQFLNPFKKQFVLFCGCFFQNFIQDLSSFQRRPTGVIVRMVSMFQVACDENEVVDYLLSAFPNCAQLLLDYCKHVNASVFEKQLFTKEHTSLVKNLLLACSKLASKDDIQAAPRKQDITFLCGILLKFNPECVQNAVSGEASESHFILDILDCVAQALWSICSSEVDNSSEMFSIGQKPKTLLLSFQVIYELMLKGLVPAQGPAINSMQELIRKIEKVLEHQEREEQAKRSTAAIFQLLGSPNAEQIKTGCKMLMSTAGSKGKLQNDVNKTGILIRLFKKIDIYKNDLETLDEVLKCLSVLLKEDSNCLLLEGLNASFSFISLTNPTKYSATNAQDAKIAESVLLHAMICLYHMTFHDLILSNLLTQDISAQIKSSGSLLRELLGFLKQHLQSSNVQIVEQTVSLFMNLSSNRRLADLIAQHVNVDALVKVLKDSNEANKPSAAKSEIPEDSNGTTRGRRDSRPNVLLDTVLSSQKPISANEDDSNSTRRKISRKASITLWNLSLNDSTLQQLETNGGINEMLRVLPDTHFESLDINRKKPIIPELSLGPVSQEDMLSSSSESELLQSGRYTPKRRFGLLKSAQKNSFDKQNITPRKLSAQTESVAENKRKQSVRILKHKLSQLEHVHTATKEQQQILKQQQKKLEELLEQETTKVMLKRRTLQLKNLSLFSKRAELIQFMSSSEKEYILSLLFPVGVMSRSFKQIEKELANEEPVPYGSITSSLGMESFRILLKVVENLERIVLVNKDYFRELHNMIKEHQKETGSSNCHDIEIGKLFLKRVPLFRLYKIYIQNYYTILRVLKQSSWFMQKSQTILLSLPSLSATSSKPSSNSNEESETDANRIFVILEKPIHRFHSYCILLRDIIDSTPREHPDYQYIEQSLAEMDKIDQEFLLKIKEQKQYEKLVREFSVTYEMKEKYFLEERIGFPVGYIGGSMITSLASFDCTTFNLCYEKYKASQSKKLEVCQKKWASFVSDWSPSSTRIMQSPQNILEAKKMIKKYNCLPPEIRPLVWFEISGAKRKMIANEGYYKKILDIHQSHVHSGAFEQIDKDLMRTFPKHPLFEKESNPVYSAMRRILIAYIWRNPLIAYVQSFNFIVAFLLIHFPEEESFWMFVSIIEDILPMNYYNPKLKGVHVDTRVFEELVQDRLPKLYNHMSKKIIGFNLPLFTTTLFMKLCLNDLPIETSLEIWDLMLCDGSYALFYCLLAIFKNYEDEIMTWEDAADVYERFPVILVETFNIWKLLQDSSKILLGLDLPSKVDMLRQKFIPIVDAQLKN